MNPRKPNSLLFMEGESSWISHCTDFRNSSLESNSFSDLHDDIHRDFSAVSLDAILPDDLLERILAYLPIVSIFRVGSVCKRWHEIVASRRFLWNQNHVSSRKPWYFMFTSSDKPVGYAYDPILKKWYDIDLPCIETSNWFIASSRGLVCFMDNDSRSELYICNPITRSCKDLDKPPGPKFSDYSAIAVSTKLAANSYNVSIVKSKYVPGDFFQWELSIHLYDSEATSWITTLSEIVSGWRGGDESVICDGTLYFLIFWTGVGSPYNRHGLITYDLTSISNDTLLMESFIPVPCPLTCGRLMNLRDRLVLVGGIGKHDRPGVIKGIGIWVLAGREWEEIARMPHKLFQGFGEFDDVFASSGTDDLIYIQSYGGPALLVFDLNQKHWKWSQKCPVAKRFPLQLFSGFCFEPRLDIAP